MSHVWTISMSSSLKSTKMLLKDIVFWTHSHKTRLCFLYIKDTSKHFKFVYKMVSDFNTTEDSTRKSKSTRCARLSLCRKRSPLVWCRMTRLNIHRCLSFIATQQRKTVRSPIHLQLCLILRPKVLAVLQEQEANGFLYVCLHLRPSRFQAVHFWSSWSFTIVTTKAWISMLPTDSLSPFSLLLSFSFTF